MKIKNALVVLMLLSLSIFYTSCSTTPTPEACFKILDTLGREISSAKLNEPIYFSNCGDRYILNAVFPGVSHPLPKLTLNPITGAADNDGKVSVYGVEGSVGVIIPANNTEREGTPIFNSACIKYVYGNNTSVTGVCNVVYITSNVGDNGKEIVRSEPKKVSFTVNPD